MKIILSRKGIDGGNGRGPSPLIKNSSNEWVPVSIPIGGTCEKWRYHQIDVNGHNLGNLAKSLQVKDRDGYLVSENSPVHFDPDLDRDSAKRKDGWMPMFGQGGGSLSHLLDRYKVAIGDLFLFWGWFKKSNGANLNYTSNLHAVFGWLQIGDIWNVEGKTMSSLQQHHPEWAWEHPHFQCDHGKGCGSIFVAAKTLRLGGKIYGLPGAGVFRRFSTSSQLTWPGEQKRSIWKLPAFFHKRNHPRLSYHWNEARWTSRENEWQLKSAARGQEFVLDFDKLEPENQKIARSWAVNLIKEHI